MEATSINVALAIFVAAVAMGLFYLWRKAAEIRDALTGKDGHKLMVIFARIFLVGFITSSFGTVRWLSLIVLPEAEWFRQLIAFVNATLLISVNVWALLAVRGIIESGRMPRE